MTAGASNPMLNLLPRQRRIPRPCTTSARYVSNSSLCVVISSAQRLFFFENGIEHSPISNLDSLYSKTGRFLTFNHSGIRLLSVGHERLTRADGGIVPSFLGNSPSHPPAPCSPRYAGRAGGEMGGGCGWAAKPPTHIPVPLMPPPHAAERRGEGVGGRGWGYCAMVNTAEEMTFFKNRQRPKTPVNSHDAGLAKSKKLNRLEYNLHWRR